MDNQRNPLLNWAYYCQPKSMEELRQSLLLNLLELDNTRLKAQEELELRDYQLTQLKYMINRAIKERDEAQEKYQRLIFEKLILQQYQQTAQLSGISSIEDEPRRGLDSNNGFSSSDCEESIVSSSVINHQVSFPPPQLPPQPPLPQRTQPPSEQELTLVTDKSLPENGKFLQAVMKAGPLLQNLLLAGGPLPQWRHPPPPLDIYQIPAPPVVIPSSTTTIDNCGRVNRKRGFYEGYDSSREMKYQRVVLH